MFPFNKRLDVWYEQFIGYNKVQFIFYLLKFGVSQMISNHLEKVR